MEAMGPEMRKEMGRTIRKITEIQSLARQLEDMSDAERNDFKKRRTASHGMAKSEMSTAAQKVGLKPKAGIGKQEEIEVADDEVRGRNATLTPRSSEFQSA